MCGYPAPHAEVPSRCAESLDSSACMRCIGIVYIQVDQSPVPAKVTGLRRGISSNSYLASSGVGGGGVHSGCSSTRLSGIVVLICLL